MRAGLILSLFLCLAGRAPAHAAGEEPFGFLGLDADARAAGLGGAYSARARDANAVLYNPAGLGWVRYDELAFMSSRHFQGVSQQYASYASGKGFGMMLDYVGYGHLEETTVSRPDGTGSFGASELALSAGYGRRTSERLAFGAALKYLKASIEEAEASGFAVDFGALGAVPGVRGLYLAAVLQNIGQDVKFEREKERLPFAFRLGASYESRFREKPVSASLDLIKLRGGLEAGLGVEVRAFESFPLRLGYATRIDAGPGFTMGLGWVRRSFRFDYAFAPYGELGFSHRFSMGLRWGMGEGPAPRSDRREAAVREPPEGPEDRLQRADWFISQGRFEEALHQLKLAAQVLEEDDRRWVRVYERRGHIAMLSEDFRTAKMRYKQALAVAVHLGMSTRYAAEAYSGLGQCMMREEDRVMAIVYFRKALELEPPPALRSTLEDRLRSLGAIPPRAD